MNPFDDTNPHNVMDGLWGGWSKPRWFYAEAWGFAQGDVVERAGAYNAVEHGYARDPDKWKWVRIWVDAEKRWRALAPEEIAKLPANAEP